MPDSGFGESREGSLIGTREIPSPEGAGISRDEYKELVKDPIHNRVALMSLLVETEAEELKNIYDDYDQELDTETAWTSPEMITKWIEETKPFLAGYTGRPFKDYAEHLVIALYNRALEDAKLSRGEIESLQKEVLTGPNFLKEASAKDLVSHSKMLARAEDKIKKSLMAYHFITSEGSSFSTS